MSSLTLQNNRPRNRNRQHTSLGRGGYPNTNNYRRETPEPEPSNASPIRGLFADHRTTVVMSSFLGTHTRVKTPNGKKYEGHTTGFSEKGDIALRDVKLEDDNHQNPVMPGIIIPKDQFVMVETKGVDIKGLSSSDFTDAGIVSRMNGASETPLRELQPWQDDDAPDMSSTLSLDDTMGGWDSNSMFQVNTEKFNVQSSYNEAMPEYTTKLPDPASEGYEERQKFAQKHAEEIEKSDAYQNRISKEVTDGDEESKYSAVHRSSELHSSLPRTPHEPSTNNGKNSYTSAMRDGEQNIRNGGMQRGQGRALQRQNSPYSSTNHQQHQSMQNTRQMNNHYQGSPPAGSPPTRNSGPPALHRQQQPPQSQNHAAPPHSHHQSFPPPPHSVMQQQQHHHQQQQQLPVSQQQQARPTHQHLVSPTQHPNKSHPPPHHQPNVPPSMTNTLSQQPPPPSQHPASQKLNLAHSQSPSNKTTSPNTNDPAGPQQSGNPLRHQVSMQVSGDGQGVEVLREKSGQTELSSQSYHRQPATTLPLTNSLQKVAESSQTESPQMTQAGASAVPSPTTAQAADRRVGRGSDTSPEETRNKIGQQLIDFKRNFVLESNGASSQEPQKQDEPSVSVPLPSVLAATSLATTAISSNPDPAISISEQTAESSNKTNEKIPEEPPALKSKLNPNAKEFKPKAQTMPVETQSPSPQPRSSPLMPQVVYVPSSYAPGTPFYVQQPFAAQRKKATVSLGTGDLQAQVTGQPLLANQPHAMMYIQPGQPLPGYHQIHPPQMFSSRMVAPNSLNIAQTGQVTGLEQTGNQSAPQPVFMTAQQQPIPAHLHPQPAHGQPLTHPSSNQQAQPAHVPNPAPSPVQHQPQHTQPVQQMPHHMTQGPSQSATPQPAHYPSQISLSYTHGMSAIPRTSMSGQQSLHPTVSISYPLMSAPQYSSYPNGSSGQYTFAPAAQPQTSQNSSHGASHQTHQYVMMPQPNPQHPPMQQPATQPYTTGIPFPSQHNIMQGPPQMPPTHAPNQGGHLIHSGMPAGMHQPVPGTQPVYMQGEYRVLSPPVYMQASPVGSMPHQLYMPRDGSRSAINPSTVSAPTIMFTWP